MGKNKRKNRDESEYEYDPAPKHLQIGHIKNQEKRLIVILENAQLESVKVRLYFLMSINVFTNFNNAFLIVINYFFVFTILIFYKHNRRLEVALNC